MWRIVGVSGARTSLRRCSQSSYGSACSRITTNLAASNASTIQLVVSARTDIIPPALHSTTKSSLTITSFSVPEIVTPLQNKINQHMQHKLQVIINSGLGGGLKTNVNSSWSKSCRTRKRIHRNQWTVEVMHGTSEANTRRLMSRANSNHRYFFL